ncbi:MAG: MCE family protein [Planctomycetes bacterium]|nr:MCE family protein [Planctomycetota bacterium]
MNTSHHFLLGLLVVGALTILGYFTLFLSDFTMLGEVQHMTIHFPDANGLREGDSVLVAGVRWGKVSTIAYDPTTDDPARRITVMVTLDEPVVLHQDHSILIADATVLGGKNLTIDPGSVDAPAVSVDTVLFGQVRGNVMQQLEELLAANEQSVTETLGSLHDLVQGVRDGRGTMGRLFTDDELASEMDRAVRGAAEAADNLRAITAKLEAGEGTLGQLLMKDELYQDLKSIGESLTTLLDDANATLADARAGKGLAGALLSDEELSQNIKDGVRDLKQIIERTNKGENTLGHLLTDKKIAMDIETVMDRLANGQGTLGRLFAEDEIYEDVRQTASDLRDIIAQVRDGRGTVGKLLMEEGLYTELLKAVGLLTRSLEEYREAAPISTMTSVIFGAF